MNPFQKFRDLLGFKSSGTVRAIVFMDQGTAKHTPRNYEALAREGYEWCVTAYACVKDISEAVAGINIKLYRKRKSGTRDEIHDHPILKLLERPNPLQSYPEFIRDDTSRYLLAGNSYIEAVGIPKRIEDVTGPLNGPPRELWGLRPDRVKIIPSADTIERLFEYSANGLVQRFDSSRILHRKTFHPNNDYYGLSPLEPAGTAIDTDNESNRWNLSLLQNQARPSGILIVKGSLTDDQFQRLQDQFKRDHTGPENAGKPLVFEAGKDGGDWKQVSISPAEMEYLSGRKMNKREICQAFGWPAELVGDSENKTYSNYAEARKSAYTETVLPYLDLMVASWNYWLLPKFDTTGSLLLAYDKDDIETLQEDRQKKIESARGLFDSGLATANEARKLIGMAPTNDDFGDVRLIPFSKMPVDDLASSSAAPDPSPAAAPAAPPALEDWTDPNADNGKRRALGLISIGSKTYAMNERTFALYKGITSVNLKTETARVQHWKSIDRQRMSWIRKSSGIFTRVLRDDYQAIGEAARDCTTKEQIIHRANDILIRSNEKWMDAFRSAYSPVISDFADRSFNEFKAAGFRLQHKDDGFTWDDAVTDYLHRYGAKKVSQVSNTTRKNIVRIVDAGDRNGDSIPEIAAAIIDEADGNMPKYRAERIARTETIGASNYASIAGAEETGLDLTKEWISTRDDKTRSLANGDEFDHVQCDGETQEMDRDFEGTGEALSFPADPKGSAGNIIECRCTVGFQVKS